MQGCSLSVVYIAVIGAVEELSTSPETLSLIRDQFETNFFGPVNIIKAVLPAMRARSLGHIMVMTDISKCFPLPLALASEWVLLLSSEATTPGHRAISMYNGFRYNPCGLLFVRRSTNMSQSWPSWHRRARNVLCFWVGP